MIEKRVCSGGTGAQRKARAVFLVGARFYRRESKARTLKHYKVHASKAPRRKVRASKMRQGARARLETAPRRGACEAPRACIARVDAHCSEMLLISHISYALPPRRRPWLG